MEISKLQEIADEISSKEMLPGITYIEVEGPNSVRIDWGKGKSLWLNSNDTFNGTALGWLREWLKKEKGFKGSEGYF